MVKFVRNNFMQGMRFKKDFKSLDELNDKAKKWLDNIANEKIHSVTKERPMEMWLKEKPFLSFPHNLPSYEIFIFQPGFSTKDGTIKYKSSVYPVPFRYARRKLFVKEVSQNGVSILEIYNLREIVAKYYLSRERNNWVKESEAIFFKNDSKRKAGKTPKRSKINYLKSSPVILPRPMTYYNQFIPEGSMRP